MPKRYLLDTCIWRDFYEERFGPGGRPLGKLAAKLLMKIIEDKDIILFNDLIVNELRSDYSAEEVELMLSFFFYVDILEKVDIRFKDAKEAKKIGQDRDIPTNDALHAIIARNNRAILVSQDKHFSLLKDIVEVKRPDELI